jgi:hypothetical protein
LTTATDVFVWKSHPLRERPQKAIAGVAIVLALVFTVGLAFGPAWAFISLLFLFVSLNRFWFPTTYAIDSQGITAHYPTRKRRMRWEDLRRFVYDANGGFISTRSQPSRLDPYSGMHLLFGEHREEVIARIHGHLNSAIATEESSTPAATRPEQRVPVTDGGAA